MKIVVGGAGKIGSTLIHELYHEGHKVTVIDPNPHAPRTFPAKT